MTFRLAMAVCLVGVCLAGAAPSAEAGPFD